MGFKTCVLFSHEHIALQIEHFQDLYEYANVGQDWHWVLEQAQQQQVLEGIISSTYLWK